MIGNKSDGRGLGPLPPTMNGCPHQHHRAKDRRVGGWLRNGCRSGGRLELDVVQAIVTRTAGSSTQGIF